MSKLTEEELAYHWKFCDGTIASSQDLLIKMSTPIKQHISGLEAELGSLQTKIKGFYDVLAHGDEEHRRWLKEMVDEYFELEASGE